jgi:hypothetical protein
MLNKTGGEAAVKGNEDTRRETAGFSSCVESRRAHFNLTALCVQSAAISPSRCEQPQSYN